MQSKQSSFALRAVSIETSERTECNFIKPDQSDQTEDESFNNTNKIDNSASEKLSLPSQSSQLYTLRSYEEAQSSRAKE